MPALRLTAARNSRRIAALAALLALGGVWGFAAWATLVTRESAQHIRRSNALSDAFQQARFAVAREETLEHQYRLQPDPHTQERLLAEARSLRRALARVQASGGTADRTLAAAALARNDDVLRAFASVVHAIEQGRLDRVDAIEAAQVSPAFTAMERSVDRAAGTHRARATQSLASSQRSDTIVFVIVVVTCALGVLFLVAGAIALRYRSRLELARQHDLARLRRAALSDSLTDLPNHRAFQQDLEQAFAKPGPLALAMLDLDNLKQTNDTRGHQAGDELIVGLSAALRHALAGRGQAYRIGGDEFAVILPGARALDALEFVQRVHVAPAFRAAHVAATAGLAERLPALARGELIRRADLALIEAKRAHRQALIYTPALEIAPADAGSRHYVDTLATALARAVDAKDAYTRSHCEAVSELCVAIAEELGLSERRVQRIRLAGLLHDVGKIGIADAILQKPGPLAEDEYEVMKTHSMLGFHIVSAAELPDEARFILHHHERLDGRGYPEGLRGEQIPLEARIIHVADTFEAITTDRPYRARSCVAEALAELEQHVGTQFDPRCVAALRGVLGVQDEPVRLAA
jgi:diguanylate cyclase (GGDEF)-like protein/putative nucleotidyltransferase with HDIG domain